MMQVIYKYKVDPLVERPFIDVPAGAVFLSMQVQKTTKTVMQQGHGGPPRPAYVEGEEVVAWFRHAPPDAKTERLRWHYEFIGTGYQFEAPAKDTLASAFKVFEYVATLQLQKGALVLHAFYVDLTRPPAPVAVETPP